jgi:hypothetical protein
MITVSGRNLTIKSGYWDYEAEMYDYEAADPGDMYCPPTSESCEANIYHWHNGRRGREITKHIGQDDYREICDALLMAVQDHKADHMLEAIR